MEDGDSSNIYTHTHRHPPVEKFRIPRFRDRCHKEVSVIFWTFDQLIGAGDPVQLFRRYSSILYTNRSFVEGKIFRKYEETNIFFFEI